MTYYGAKELARSFRTVRNNTIKIAEEIPEDQYGFEPAKGCRSVAETLAHIAVMTRVPEQIHFTEHRSTLVGFDFFDAMNKLRAETKAPRTKAQILELLSSEGERYAKALEGASEAFLSEQVEYPEGMEPRLKSRFEMLVAAKEHEMHHRGQLMVVQRMLGITPHLTRQMEERIAAMQAAQLGR
ncbi:MAG TPA: DinB family protein [Bryobacteraceae bacterium]|nr:DinB family protein [Bryobacteraceae bacterium]